MNSTGRPNASVTAKIADSQNPTTSTVTPRATSVWRSSTSCQMWRMPSVSSSRQCWALRTGWSSCTRIVAMTAAATRNDAASTTATAPPPSPENSAAPASGPTSRKLSLMVCSEAFASTSSRGGITSLSSPLSPAGTTTNEMP